MTKDVFVSLSGEQILNRNTEEETKDITSVECQGSYDYKGGFHVIRFTETGENNETTKSMVCVKPDYFKIIRKGAITTTMIFESNRSAATDYQTPYGVLQMQTDTQKVVLEEFPDRLEVQLFYQLKVNGEVISDSKMEFVVSSMK